jgi:hypothetical protein
MFKKSVKEFFKNPIITIPNIITLSLISIFSEIFMKADYLNKLTPGGTITNYEDISVEMAKLISYLLLILMFYFFISPLVLASISLMTKKVTSETKPKFLDCVREALKYYCRLLGVSIFKILIFLCLGIAFMLALVPFLVNIKSYTAALPIGANILLLLYVISIVIFGVILMPIEVILVYDNLTIGGAISKGFKFGYRKLLKLLLVSILVFALIIISDYIFINLPPSLSIISTLFVAYITTFLNVYITNLYIFSIKPPIIVSPSITETDVDAITQEATVEKNPETKAIEKENKFII